MPTHNFNECPYCEAYLQSYLFGRWIDSTGAPDRFKARCPYCGETIQVVKVGVDRDSFETMKGGE